MQIKDYSDSEQKSFPTFDQLPQLYAEQAEQLREIKEIIRNSFDKQTKPSDWLTTIGLAEYIHRSKQWVYQRTGNAPEELPPMHRQGAKILFKRSEVDQWLNK